MAGRWPGGNGGDGRGRRSWLPRLRDSRDRPDDYGPVRLTCWHLTPRGWIRGYSVHGGRSGNSGASGPPADRVMTCAFLEDGVHREVHVLRVEDADQARRLVWRYGLCPWSHGGSAHPGVVEG